MRYSDWPKRLSDFLATHQKLPFVWGENDCVLFGAKCIEALTGENYYKEYLGYTTEEQAYNIIKQNGGIHHLISKHLGQPRKNVLKSTRGDLVLIKTPRSTIGVIDDAGRYIVCVSESGGLIRYNIEKAKLVWGY